MVFFSGCVASFMTKKDLIRGLKIILWGRKIALTVPPQTQLLLLLSEKHSRSVTEKKRKIWGNRNCPSEPFHSDLLSKWHLNGKIALIYHRIILNHRRIKRITANCINPNNESIPTLDEGVSERGCEMETAEAVEARGGVLVPIHGSGSKRDGEGEQV